MNRFHNSENEEEYVTVGSLKCMGLDDSSSRKSSILKHPKPRLPLKEVNLKVQDEEEVTETDILSRRRRVSFTGVKKIKEFHSKAESVHIINTPSYEENVSTSSELSQVLPSSEKKSSQPTGAMIVDVKESLLEVELKSEINGADNCAIVIEDTCMRVTSSNLYFEKNQQIYNEENILINQNFCNINKGVGNKNGIDLQKEIRNDTKLWVQDKSASNHSFQKGISIDTPFQISGVAPFNLRDKDNHFSINRDSEPHPIDENMYYYKSGENFNCANSNSDGNNYCDEWVAAIVDNLFEDEGTPTEPKDNVAPSNFSNMAEHLITCPQTNFGDNNHIKNFPPSATNPSSYDSESKQSKQKSFSTPKNISSSSVQNHSSFCEQMNGHICKKQDQEEEMKSAKQISQHVINDLQGYFPSDSRIEKPDNYKYKNDKENVCPFDYIQERGHENHNDSNMDLTKINQPNMAQSSDLHVLNETQECQRKNETKKLTIAEINSKNHQCNFRNDSFQRPLNQNCILEESMEITQAVSHTPHVDYSEDILTIRNDFISLENCREQKETYGCRSQNNEEEDMEFTKGVSQDLIAKCYMDNDSPIKMVQKINDEKNFLRRNCDDDMEIEYSCQNFCESEEFDKALTSESCLLPGGGFPRMKYTQCMNFGNVSYNNSLCSSNNDRNSFVKTVGLESMKIENSTDVSSLTENIEKPECHKNIGNFYNKNNEGNVNTGDPVFTKKCSPEPLVSKHDLFNNNEQSHFGNNEVIKVVDKSLTVHPLATEIPDVTESFKVNECENKTEATYTIVKTCDPFGIINLVEKETEVQPVVSIIKSEIETTASDQIKREHKTGEILNQIHNSLIQETVIISSDNSIPQTEKVVLDLEINTVSNKVDNLENTKPIREIGKSYNKNMLFFEDATEDHTNLNQDKVNSKIGICNTPRTVKTQLTPKTSEFLEKTENLDGLISIQENSEISDGRNTTFENPKSVTNSQAFEMHINVSISQPSTFLNQDGKVNEIGVNTSFFIGAHTSINYLEESLCNDNVKEKDDALIENEIHDIKHIGSYEINGSYISKKLGFIFYHETVWKKPFFRIATNLTGTFYLVLTLDSKQVNSDSIIKDLHFLYPNKFSGLLIDFLSTSIIKQHEEMCINFRDKKLIFLEPFIASIIKDVKLAYQFQESVQHFRQNYPCDISENMLQFSVVNVKRRKYFRIEINMNNWRNITKNDVKAIDGIGPIRKEDILNIFDAILPSKDKFLYFAEALHKNFDLFTH